MERLKTLMSYFKPETKKPLVGERLRLVDNRTAKVYEVEIKEGKDCYYI